MDDQKEKQTDPLESAIVTNGIELTEQEELNLHDFVAMKEGYIGAFFVHRFTKSNIAGKMMVCFSCISNLYAICFCFSRERLMLCYSS